MRTPVKFANEGLDPLNSDLHKLFMFWQCYVEEERLLAEWPDCVSGAPTVPAAQINPADLRQNVGNLTLQPLNRRFEAGKVVRLAVVVEVYS